MGYYFKWTEHTVFRFPVQITNDVIIFRAPRFTVWSKALWSKGETSRWATAPAENPFTAERSPTKISRWSTTNRFCCPWPTEARTPTDPSSSSPPLPRLIWVRPLLKCLKYGWGNFNYLHSFQTDSTWSLADSWPGRKSWRRSKIWRRTRKIGRCRRFGLWTAESWSWKRAPNRRRRKRRLIKGSLQPSPYKLGFACLKWTSLL